jgi:phosphoribosylformimino-5-aminoimidazole carboxamide ribotide isomerase
VEILPAVDVLDGRVVRLLRGDYSRATVYADDPVKVARRWIAEGATRVHLVDLQGARTGRMTPGICESFGEAGIPFQVGGGIRDEVAAAAACAAGASRVVVGTAAVYGALRSIVAAVGDERVVAAVDVREGRSLGSGWEDEGRDWWAVLAEVVEAGVPRVLTTGITRDGTLQGPDISLIRAVASAAPSLAVIASGGVGDLADIEALTGLDVEAAIVGRALYDGIFELEDALRAATAAD